jgi:hypothetical protein
MTYDNPLLPDDPAPAPRRERSLREIERAHADALRIFALCRRAACYRARRCGGNPWACVPRYEPMVPEGARDWVEAASGEHDRDWIVETLAEEFPDEFEAITAWGTAVENSCIPQASPPRASVTAAPNQPVSATLPPSPPNAAAPADARATALPARLALRVRQLSAAADGVSRNSTPARSGCASSTGRSRRHCSGRRKSPDG